MTLLKRLKLLIRKRAYRGAKLGLNHLPDLLSFGRFSVTKVDQTSRWSKSKVKKLKSSNSSKPHFSFWASCEQRVLTWGQAILAQVLRLGGDLITYLQGFIKHLWGDGALYLRGLFIVFFVDALVIDDEPLWEPIEWSMVQSWILFIFLFAWIAENLIVSRYGSYTGRDKRVWFAWYKTFWLIGFWYALTMGAAVLFVMVPFYYEINYVMSFVMSWWNWYTRVFFFKFLSLNVLLLLVAQLMQLNARWWNWKNLLFLIITITFFFSYLLYTQFLMTFFAYFTNVNWYNSSRLTDYVQLSHEPNKWGWGASKRDHFSYHKSTTVFCYKNDGPLASAFMFIQFLFVISLFLLSFYWMVLLRRVYHTQEFSYTYLTYAVSVLKQLFYFFLAFYLFIFMSYLLCYWRFPLEFIWLTNSYPWWTTFGELVLAYPGWIVSLFL